MSNKLTKILLAAVAVPVLFLGILFFNNDLGLPKSKIPAEVRKSQKISADWVTEGTVSDSMAAYISYPEDKSDFTFSVYVNRPGLSLGYFFRYGGSISDMDNGIVNFIMDGYGESAYISMNRQKTARREIDDGNNIRIIEIDSNKPFAFVLPVNRGNITFYDTSGNRVESRKIPM